MHRHATAQVGQRKGALSVAAIGRAEQRKQRAVLRDLTQAGARVAQLGQGLQRSLQYSSGVEFRLPSEFTASLTGFYNIFLNMTDAFGLGNGTVPRDDSLSARSLGSGIGLELSVRRPLTRRLG